MRHFLIDPDRSRAVAAAAEPMNDNRQPLPSKRSGKSLDAVARDHIAATRLW